jgi:transcription elongation factor GreA
MFAFLTGFLKAFSTVNETVISSYLIIKSIVKSYPFLNPGFNYSFDDLFSEIENLEETFSAIEDTDIKRQFLLHIKKEEKNWQDLFVRLFPYYLSKFIIDELESAGAENRIKELIFGIIDNYREKREAFIWIARNIDMETWTAEKGIHYEKILIGMVHLLDITFREIDNRRDVSPNRKINKQIQNYLFKEVNLENFLLKADEESISRLFTLVEDVKDLDASIKIELKHKIIEKFPDFKFYGETETETVSRGLLVTAASYKLKQKELQHIIEVDIPENSKEIGAAIQLGDLSENAEYKAGKERQELLNIAIGKLKHELEKARIFKMEDVDTAQVSFGTVVDLKNIDSGKNEKYTFLGPWESDPNRNIISYLSPFGNKFWNHEIGEKLEFVINDRQYHYEVVSIEKTTI